MAGAFAGLLWGLFVLLLAAAPGYAQHVSEDPILRLETGTHLGRVDRLDLDAAERLLITAGQDRTARIWDAATGELLQILRLPVDEGNEGLVLSAALSPDGRIAAVGGWTLYGRVGDNSIFFFDTASGRMTGRVDGFGDFVSDLEFSPDGRLLAITTASDADLAILDMERLTVAHWLRGYADSAFNAVWAPDGGLVTTSDDGWLRRYDAAFRLIAAVPSPSGHGFFGAAFSPDGKRLAVGVLDHPGLWIFDAVTLDLLFEVETIAPSGLADFGKPGWSPDGSVLIAGTSFGQYFGEEWAYTVRLWEQGGLGPYHDLGVTADGLLDLKVSTTGLIYMAAGGGELRVMDLDGYYRWTLDPAKFAFNSTDRSHLRLSPDGRVIGVTPFNLEPLTFDLGDRRLLEAPYEHHPPLEAAGGLRFSNWHMSRAPRLNGAEVVLDNQFETATAVAVAEDGSFGLLGSEWNFYGFDADGGLLYSRRISSVPWAVNVNTTGNVFVAAHGDGTLRWYRAADGEELLALFLHPDRARWVAWTPSGYYDAAPGGEELIGWHVNRGLGTEPSFFPASLFRDRFYRPDIVQAVLESLDEATAIAQANMRAEQTAQPQLVATALPPVARILSPNRGDVLPRGEALVELEITGTDAAPLTDLHLRINGRLQTDYNLETVAAPAGAEDTRLLRVAIDLGEVQGDDAIITVQAVNRHGFGPPVDVIVDLEQAGFQEFHAAPRLYVLSIGVSNYLEPDLRLSYAAKDAQDMAALLVQQEGALYSEVIVRVLTDENATVDNIRDSLFWLEEQVTANDTANIFIAGHGLNDSRGELHFLPYETELDSLRRTALPALDIVRTVQYLPGRVIYFMDTCYSGNLDLVRRGAVTLDVNRHIQDLSAAETGAVVFSSATGSQFALESPEWGNGAFTFAVLRGMNGEADLNDDGAVSLNELNLFVSDMVKELTNNQQTPVMQKPSAIRDFPLAVLR